MTGWSERRPSDPVMIMCRIGGTPRAPKSKSCLLNTVGNWSTAGSLPDSSDGDVPDIRNLEYFTETICVAGGSFFSLYSSCSPLLVFLAVG